VIQRTGREYAITDPMVEAFRSGANGVFCRDDSSELFAGCEQRVHQVQIWVLSRQQQFVVDAVANATSSAIVDSRGVDLLTKRELSVVILVAEGRSNRDISHELRLGEHSVRNDMFRI
jgi:two-component system nitrate/nitrite response regulator NarL